MQLCAIINVLLYLLTTVKLCNFAGTGHVTDCPAYVSVTVNDRTAGEELGQYDTLISCPPQFNITINLPRSSPSSVTADDRVFEVVLHDSKIQQRVFLSTFVIRSVQDTQHFDARSVDAGDTFNGMKLHGFRCRNFAGDVFIGPSTM